jgi:hypothetical protein
VDVWLTGPYRAFFLPAPGAAFSVSLKGGALLVNDAVRTPPQKHSFYRPWGRRSQRSISPRRISESGGYRKDGVRRERFRSDHGDRIDLSRWSQKCGQHACRDREGDRSGELRQAALAEGHAATLNAGAVPHTFRATNCEAAPYSLTVRAQDVPTDSLVIRAALRTAQTGTALLQAYRRAAELDGRLKKHKVK